LGSVPILEIIKDVIDVGTMVGVPAGNMIELDLTEEAEPDVFIARILTEYVLPGTRPSAICVDSPVCPGVVSVFHDAPSSTEYS
jgi:hypothetical protein